MKTLKLKSKILLSFILLLLFLLVPNVARADCQTSGSPSINKTTGKPTSTATQQEINQCLQNNKIVTDLNKIVDFLSAGVGIVVVGVILLGGIQYTLAGANTTALAAARKRIINGLIALAVFMLIYAFLQWIIPGGVFG